MGNCKYPKYIKKNNIELLEDASENNCYKVSIEVSNQGKTILIISNYPKRIDSRGCSKILKKITRYIKEKSYKNFINGILASIVKELGD